MLRDRRELLEQDIERLAWQCGRMYIGAMREEQSAGELKAYHESVTKLTTMKTELGIIDKMIDDGHV